MLRPDGFVKVLDFGLARLAPAGDSVEATQTSFRTEGKTIVGTVAYMSPEQARGQEVDARTDVWSLGVVLYEMTAGRSPFVGRSSSDVLAAILDREPDPLARVDPSVPAELQRIVTTALRKDRQQRYQSSQELYLDVDALRQQRDPLQNATTAKVLRGATDGVAISLRQKLGSRRIRILSAVITGLFLVTLLVGIGSAIQWLRGERDLIATPSVSASSYGTEIKLILTNSGNRPAVLRAISTGILRESADQGPVFFHFASSTEPSPPLQINPGDIRIVRVTTPDFNKLLAQGGWDASPSISKGRRIRLGVSFEALDARGRHYEPLYYVGTMDVARDHSIEYWNSDALAPMSLLTWHHVESLPQVAAPRSAGSH